MARLNTHMTHLEDAVFLLGIKDTRQSIDFLRGLRDMLKGHADKPINTTVKWDGCLLYTSPSPRDVEESRMPSSA